MKSTRQKEIEDDIRSRHGGMLTLANIMEELGHVTQYPAVRFARKIPSFEINGRKRWRVSDVAEALAKLEVSKW